MHHRTADELQAGLAAIVGSPADQGTLAVIARRIGPGEREVLDRGQLRADVGLVGDNWLTRGSRRTPDGAADLDRQITIMSSRAIALFAGDRARWALAGDQLYVDLDLSEANLPAGTRLAIGTAMLEVTAAPHTGCPKFVDRFGQEVLRFVSRPDTRELRLRGINARVVVEGEIRTGDPVVKQDPAKQDPAVKQAG